MEIKGKVALVTGGAHRVGKAIALMLAGAGADVAINYNSSASPANTTVAEAEALGVSALAVQADISDYEQVRAMAGRVEAAWGGVDILVNSADRWEPTPFPDEDITAWTRVTGVAINGAYYVSNAFVPMMLARGGGAMVNIVDMSAWRPWSNFTAHAVGKSALLAMTRQFALELAPDIRVNAVAPGPVLPPADYGPRQIARTAAKTLLQRWGTPDDVTQAVKFLLEADYITGETIFVDGGEQYGYRAITPDE